MSTQSQVIPVISQLIRGDTLELPMTFTLSGQAIDITGWKVAFTAKTNIDDANADAQVQYNEG